MDPLDSMEIIEWQVSGEKEKRCFDVNKECGIGTKCPLEVSKDCLLVGTFKQPNRSYDAKHAWAAMSNSKGVSKCDYWGGDLDGRSRKTLAVGEKFIDSWVPFLEKYKATKATTKLIVKQIWMYYINPTRSVSERISTPKKQATAQPANFKTIMLDFENPNFKFPPSPSPWMALKDAIVKSRKFVVEVQDKITHEILQKAYAESRFRKISP